MGVFDAFANIVSTLETNWQNESNVQATNDHNRRMVELQNAENLAQWKRENAYNSPVNQVQRLRAAGLNPGLLYGQPPSNTAAPSPTMRASRDIASQAVAPSTNFNLDDLRTIAEIKNIDADTDKKKKEAEYQQYINDVESALAHLPIGQVKVIDENGNEEVQVIYGNARVITNERQLKALGLSVTGLEYQLADLFFDLAVKTGGIEFVDLSTFDPRETDGYKEEIEGLRGDRKVREVAGRLAVVGEQAANAENAGREAYAKWLEKNKDKPLVQFALALQGFLQTAGFTLPKIGSTTTSTPVKGGVKTSHSWYFGK